MTTGRDDGPSRAHGRPDVTLAFAHDTAAPGAARSVMKDLLNDVEDPICVDVALVTSELVANVIIHTANGGVLRAWDPKPNVPLRLEVEDSDDRVPAVMAELPTVGGRGLRIVDAASDAWGVDPLDGGGKVVWAEFDRNNGLHG